jgi:SAM-dependent methyltransferase
MRPSPRVDYDQIAHLYDSQPYRQKAVDPHLLAFLDDHPDVSLHTLSILDMGCGTGSQLVANRPHVAEARLVGLDLFHGMLSQARPKADEILWVQADNVAPPFPNDTFDFISNQFSFHHVRDKPAMLYSVLRILRPGGRFVMINICPREMTGWLYYQYFPAALEIDLQDFLPQETLLTLMDEVGFINIALDLDQQIYEQDLRQFVETVRRRDTCSQLIAIPDAHYRMGLQWLITEIEQAGDQLLLAQAEFCLLTLRAEKP